MDTGGFVAASGNVFEEEIAKQVRLAVNEAAVILFMVDAQTGITDLDEDMGKLLRRSKKPVLLVVNKVDNFNNLLEANEFYGLTKFFSEVGYYETPMHQKLYNDLKAHIQLGGILAFTGSVGSGKTTHQGKG